MGRGTGGRGTGTFLKSRKCALSSLDVCPFLYSIINNSILCGNVKYTQPVVAGALFGRCPPTFQVLPRPTCIKVLLLFYILQ